MELLFWKHKEGYQIPGGLPNEEFDTARGI
jgi:hypothetical protein